MRLAFLMGSNGPDDPTLSRIRYATSDALMMEEHLSGSRCGFEVIRPRPEASILDIQAELSNAVRACSADDTFLCYFAGHGLVERAELFLLWDSSNVRGLFGTALPVSHILMAMRFCNAASKLLILDCCHAGAAVAAGGLRSGMNDRAEDIGVNPENHLVLMASDRLERAREIAELGGGFLTAQVCRALGECFKEADTDGDGKLSLDELKTWLDRMTAKHNSVYADRRVPVPYLFGQSRGPFFITLDAAPWIPYEIPWPDGCVMVVLPIRPVGGHAYCIGKYPITNRQYRNVVERDKRRPPLEEPSGQYWVEDKEELDGDNNPRKSPREERWSTRQPKDGHVQTQGHWKSPFYPWRNPAFANSDQPVVCVSYHAADRYRTWVDLQLQPRGNTRLPDEHLWDFAAFGVQSKPRNKQAWLEQTAEVHHKSFAPAPLDLSGRRTNRRGVADMIGNVWEWCVPNHGPWMTSVLPPEELRGGGFSDDLSTILPYMSASVFPEQGRSQHFDIGFRLSATVPITALPDDIIHWLELHGEHLY